MPAVVAMEALVAVQGQGDVTVPAPPREPAGATVDRGGHPTPVEEQDRLAAPLCDTAELPEQRRRQGKAALPAEIHDPHARHRRPDPGRQLDPLEQGEALRTGSRAAVHGHGTLESGALRCDGPRVVARIGLLLVRGVVLLVDDHEPEVAHRREDRRARTDDDPRLPPRDPVALVATLRLPEGRVQDRDGIAEALPKAPHGLRCE